MSSIVDVVVADVNLATMLRSLKAAGLENQWNEPGPFTLFAPSDMAFGKLPAGELAELLRPHNRAKLVLMLNHHIVSGKQYYSDLRDGQTLKTVNGNELSVVVTGDTVSINGSVIQQRDLEASNGLVHSLSRLAFEVET
ncbi:MAG: fasciclin domain-containing protein [Chitinophagaceae bacterium]|nr:fasciclin domain-containing protein [Chitinophagaceae bacterium]